MVLYLYSANHGYIVGVTVRWVQMLWSTLSVAYWTNSKWCLVACVITSANKATVSPVFFPTNSSLSRNYRFSVRKLMLVSWGSLHSRGVQVMGCLYSFDVVSYEIFTGLYQFNIFFHTLAVILKATTFGLPLISIWIKVSLKWLF